MAKRWIWALVAVTLLGGALRARPALDPNPYRSVDELGYVHVALGLAETGRYGRDNLHWPPGTPVAFALAAKSPATLATTSPPPTPSSGSPAPR